MKSLGQMRPPGVDRDQKHNWPGLPALRQGLSDSEYSGRKGPVVPIVGCISALAAPAIAPRHHSGNSRTQEKCGLVIA
jgi:hypothetical protein